MSDECVVAVIVQKFHVNCCLGLSSGSFPAYALHVIRVITDYDVVDRASESLQNPEFSLPT